ASNHNCLLIKNSCVHYNERTKHCYMSSTRNTRKCSDLTQRRFGGQQGQTPGEVHCGPFPSVPLRTVLNSFPLHGSPVIIVRVVCVLAFPHEWLDDIHDRQSASFVAGPPSLVSIVAFLPVLVS